jgi:glycosyltransferase involved in cell wall biosynthesis
MSLHRIVQWSCASASSQDTVLVTHLTTAHPRKDIRIFHKECIDAAREHKVCLFAEGVDETDRGVNIRGLPRSRSRISRILFSPWLACSRVLRSDATTVHLHDPELLPIALVLKLFGRTVIYDAHEDLPRQIQHKGYIPSWLNRILMPLAEAFENLVASRVHAVVAATPTIADRFTRINRNTVTVNNYPRKDEITPERWEAKRRQVCYVGSLRVERGVMEMLGAVAKTNVRLVLAGDIQSAFRAQCEAHPGWKFIEYRGVVDRPQVANILAMSKVGICCLHPTPAYLTAQATKIYEYMAAGIPVIASDFPLWKKLVEGHGCGICVDPLNEHEIANAIEYLLRNDAEARSMGEKGRAAIEQIYNWERESEKLLGLYRELALLKPALSRQHR